MNIWDVPGGASSDMQWSSDPAASAAWASAIKTIAAIGVTSGVSAPDVLALRVSEDFWQGNAEFTVAVDGKQIGGTYTASALHATGASDVFVLTGDWGSTVHQVTVSFINDAYGGTPTTDRNLYVNSIAYDGQTYANTAATLWSNGSTSFAVGGSTPTAAAPTDTLTIKLSEDAWNGNADFVLHIDGKTVTTPEAVTALHGLGQWQSFTFAGNFGAGTHTVGIQFTNDAYGGTPATDRNLYVGGISINGAAVTPGTASLYSAGTANFTIHTSA